MVSELKLLLQCVKLNGGWGSIRNWRASLKKGSLERPEFSEALENSSAQILHPVVFYYQANRIHKHEHKQNRRQHESILFLAGKHLFSLLKK